MKSAQAVLHLIWLGASPPVQNLANLHKLAGLFNQHIQNNRTLICEDRAYLPLLWLDESAYQALISDPVITIKLVTNRQVPQALLSATQTGLQEHFNHCRWLAISINHIEQFLPLLVLEDMQPALNSLWQSPSGLTPYFAKLCKNPHGLALLQHLGLSSAATNLDHELKAIFNQDIADYLRTLSFHAKQNWGRHGLTCLASDLIRLQVVQLLPGAYIDIGDIAERLTCLPTQRLCGWSQTEFMGHQTVAIENDFFACHSPGLLQAISFGAFLWSRSCIARLLHAAQLIKPDQQNSAQLGLELALPLIDARLPAVPDLAYLFTPPFTKLANYICLAYSSHALFGDAADLKQFFQAKLVKEHLIDHIGGFTGYQKFAYLLAPNSPLVWHQSAAEFGLVDYAPQLGWKAYGFGTIDRLITDARLIQQNSALKSYAIAELKQMASHLNLDSDQLQRIAQFSATVYDLGRRAHFQPAQRDTCRALIQQAALQI